MGFHRAEEESSLASFGGCCEVGLEDDQESTRPTVRMRERAVVSAITMVPSAKKLRRGRRDRLDDGRLGPAMPSKGAVRGLVNIQEERRSETDQQNVDSLQSARVVSDRGGLRRVGVQGTNRHRDVEHGDENRH